MKVPLRRCASAVFVVTVVVAACHLKAPTSAAEEASSGKTRIVWRNIGMGGGGAFYHVTVDPTRESIVYAGIDMSGLFKSEDGAASWRNLSDLEMRSDLSHCLVVDPTDSNIVYNANKGIAKSTDGGKTWTQVCDIGRNWVMDRGPTIWASGTPMVIDPENTEVVWFGTPGGVLRRTADGGKTWEVVTDFTEDEGTAGRFREGIQSILIDTATPAENRTVYVATFEGLYRSTDNGETWQEKNEGLPHKHLLAVAGGEKDGEFRLYALLHPRMIDGQYAGGIYRSFDRGESWQEKNNGLCKWVQGGIAPEDILKYPPRTAKHCTRYYYLRVYRGDPDIAYLYADGVVDQWETRGLYRTDDGCESWRFIECETLEKSWNQSLWNGRWGLSISPTNPDVLYCCQGMNIFKSVDGGKGFCQVMSDQVGEREWQSRGLENDLFYQVVVDPDNPNSVYFTDADAGLVYTRNAGETFIIERRLPNDASALALDPDRPSDIYVGLGVAERKRAYGGLAQTRDCCETWRRVARDPASGLPRSNVIAIAVDRASPLSARTWYASSMGHGVYRSDDAGMRWRPVNDGLPEFDPADTGSGANVRKLVIPARDTVYAVVASTAHEDPGTIYKTADGGATWRALNTEQLPGTIYDLAIHPEEKTRLYCGGNGGVFESTDDGTTWSRILSEEMLSGPITERPHFDCSVHCVEIDPREPKMIYAGLRRGGVVLSEDGGKTWQFVCEGLGHRAIMDLALDPSNPRVIYAATRGQSGYRGTIIRPGEAPTQDDHAQAGPAPPERDPSSARAEFERLKQAARGQSVEAAFTSAPVTTDGILSEQAWRETEKIDGFCELGSLRLYEKQTEAHLLYDRQYLYVAMVCCEPEMGRIEAALTEHDAPLWTGDGVELLVSNDETSPEFFHFIVNPLGTRWEGKHRKAVVDAGWNPEWRAGAHRTAHAYTVEMGIPLQTVAPSAPGPGDVWKIKLCRNDAVARRYASWPLSFKGYACRPMYWADLRFRQAHT